ncbi:MAG: hypothetical protein ACRD1R_03130 [Acidobacteriota bacterium]
MAGVKQGEILAGLEQLKTSLADIHRHINQLESQVSSSQARAEGAPGLDLATINAIIQKLALATTQEEILDTYLQQAQLFVHRGILFLQAETAYLIWKSAGFPSETVEAATVEDPGDPIVRSGRQRRIIYREEPAEGDFLWPWVTQAGDLPRAVVVVPLVFGDQAPVVFYGDSQEPIPIDSLELLSHVAVLVLKSNYLQGLLQDRTEGVIDRTQAAVEKAGQEQKPSLTLVESQEQGQKTSLVTEAPEAENAPPETSPSEAVPPDEHEHLHNEAHRFARLLISEVQLYNQDEIQRGRDHKDLYRRLKRDLDRSREMYDKRIHPLVASQTDYFHEEVVRILAGGDEDALGADYPRAR